MMTTLGEKRVTLSAGDRLGRYEVRTQLGSGGMGDVYRALDTALDRDVAVKVLPDGVVGDSQRLERFQLEARAVAALSHPNILEIYDIGDQDGVQYAVTELLEGQTLRDGIPATGMAWQRVVEIGAAIADALAAAHGSGIVHRDIKPENVFVTTTGRVKVLDFGLARLHELKTPEAPTGVVLDADTQVGSVIGTVGYLSPEQVTGGEADGRSDIFALGCVLYEMVTGRSAFRRKTVAETLWATLREDPPRPSSVGALLPLDLERTIARCLEKAPEARFQSAADLAFALRAIASGSAPAVGIRSSKSFPRLTGFTVIAGLIVAAALLIGVILGPRMRVGARTAGPTLDPKLVVVLPFDNRTGDPDHDAIGLMAADWLTQDLPETVDLDMVAGSTAVAAAERIGSGPAGALDVARELGAGTLVTGAYYRQTDQLRIKAEITETATGGLLHAIGPVSGPISDPMAAVEPVRQRVLGGLAATDPRYAKFSPPTLDAYREMAAGLEIWLEKPGVGLEHFQRAAELDPDYVPALLQMSHALTVLRRFEEARSVLDELDQRRHLLASFDRLCLDCVLLRRDHRYDEALTPLREIVALDPLNPHISIGLAEALVWTNRPREAVATVECFGELDKANFTHLFPLCQGLHMLGEHERESEVAQESLRRFPSIKGYVRGGLLANAVVALAALGRSDEAAVVIERAFTESENLGVWLAWQATAELGAHGWPQEARQMAENTLERLPPSETQPPWTRWTLAVLMLVLDQPEEARALLAELVAEYPDELYIGGLAGATAAYVGDRMAAEEALIRIEDVAGPYSFGEDSYWRACIAAGLGDRELAMEQLNTALQQGQQFDLTFHRNPFLYPLHGYKPFEEFLRPKG